MVRKLIARADMSPDEKAIFDVVTRLDERGFLQAVNARCAKLHVSIEEIAGRGKLKSVVKARHAIWGWLHDECNLSWTEVAKLFGRTYQSINHVSHKRESRTRRRLEDRIAERIAAWLEGKWNFKKVAKAIRAGDWRG